MKLKKYGMRLRPAGPGCQPRGMVKFEDTNKTRTGYWSVIYYEEELTEKDMFIYSLDFLGEVRA